MLTASPMQLWHNRRRNPGVEIIVVVSTLVIVLSYAVWRYPGSTGAGGGVDLAVIYAALLAFAGAAIAVRRMESPMARAAIRRGSILGFIIGVVEALNTAIDQFTWMSGSLRQTSMRATMILIVVLFATTAIWAGKRTGSRRLAILASMWAAVIGGVITCVWGVAGNLAFIDTLQTSLHAAYVESGLGAPRDFVVHSMLESTSAHLLVVPALAFIAGIAGAWIAAFAPGFGYARLRRY